MKEVQQIEASNMTNVARFVTATAASLFILASAGAANERPALPPTNPFLMKGSFYPMVHWNSAATDVTSQSAWIGERTVKPEQVKWLPIPPSSIGTAHYPYPGGEHALFIS